MNYALYESLRIIHEEGLEQRWNRHHKNHLAFVAGIEAMGLEMLVKSGDRLWSLNTVKIPDGISDGIVRAKLLERFGIEIGGGLGPLKDKIWRVGLMGTSSQKKNVLLFLNALEEILTEEGLVLENNAGITAAERIYV